MTILRGRTAPVLLAVAALVGAANLGAYAAGGGPVLIGRTNLASATTTLKNTHAGPALRLTTRPSSPPLRVSSRKTVVHLSADTVDGLDGRALQTTDYHFSLPKGTVPPDVDFPLPKVPTGTYLASFSLFVSTGPTDQESCGFANTATDLPVHGLGYGVPLTSTPGLFTLSGSALLTSSPSHPITLTCFGSAGINIDPDASTVSGVDLVRVDRTTARAAKAG